LPFSRKDFLAANALAGIGALAAGDTAAAAAPAMPHGDGVQLAFDPHDPNLVYDLVVKNGTVVAVEAFEGTDAAMERGGRLGKGSVVLVKVSKPEQDFRFDVPVIGTRTLEKARDCSVKVVACEARRTLLLDRKLVEEQAVRWKISLYAADDTKVKEKS